MTLSQNEAGVDEDRNRALAIVTGLALAASGVGFLILRTSVVAE